MGIGKASGEGRAMEAAKLAISSKLLESSINGATGVIINVIGGSDLTLSEITEATNVISDAVSDDAEIIFGSAIDDRIQGEVQITVIATGFQLRNGEVKIKDDAKLSALDFFTKGSSLTTNSPSTSSNDFLGGSDNKPSTPTGGSFLDIPEFLNPRK